MNYKLSGACDSRTSMHGVLAYYITRSFVYHTCRRARIPWWGDTRLRQQLAAAFRPVTALRFPVLTNAGNWRDCYLAAIPRKPRRCR